MKPITATQFREVSSGSFAVLIGIMVVLASYMGHQSNGRLRVENVSARNDQGLEYHVFLPLTNKGFDFESDVIPSPVSTATLLPPVTTSVPVTLTTVPDRTPTATVVATRLTPTPPTLSIGPQPPSNPKYSGCIETEEVDTGSDGRVNYSIVRRYNSFGDQIDYLLDENADSMPEVLGMYSYNEFRKWQSHSRSRLSDKRVLSEAKFLYNGDSELIYWTNDSDGDGIENARTNYFYTPTHQITRIEEYGTGESDAKRITSYKYYDDGWVSDITVFNSLTNSTSRKQYVWRDFVLIFVNLFIDDKLGSRLSYTYDAQGLLLRTDEDVDVDGTIDIVWTYERSTGINIAIKLVKGRKAFTVTEITDQQGRLSSKRVIDFDLGWQSTTVYRFEDCAN